MQVRGREQWDPSSHSHGHGKGQVLGALAGRRVQPDVLGSGVLGPGMMAGSHSGAAGGGGGVQARLGQTWVGSWFAQVICPLVCEGQPTAVPPQALPGTLCGKCSADAWCLGVCHVPLLSAVWPPSLPWVHAHAGAALSILPRTLEAAVLGVPSVQGQPLPLDVPTALHWPPFSLSLLSPPNGSNPEQSLLKRPV